MSYKRCKVRNIDPPFQETYSFIPEHLAEFGKVLDVAFESKSEDSYNDDVCLRVRILNVGEKTYTFQEMVYKL